MSKPELHVQNFLRNGGSLERLQSLYAIKARRHGDFPHLVLLKYDQIESPFREEMVRECRGLILNEAENWEVVAMPYTKFFNAGEALAASIDWSTAWAYEKLDGSLITMYWFDDGWNIATSGTPDAKTPVGASGVSFEDLFWLTLGMRPKTGGHFNPDYCYMFELCCPENRVVVPHTKGKVVLHGVRDMRSLQELSPLGEADRLGLELIRSWQMNDLEDVLKCAGELRPLEQEGYVVCDEQFNRIKVKSPAYVVLHHAKDGLMSTRHVADIVRRGENSEALSYFPELGAMFDDISARYTHLVTAIEAVWVTIKDATDRKVFAQFATKHVFSGALFALRDGKAASAKEYLLNLGETAYHRLLGL